MYNPALPTQNMQVKCMATLSITLQVELKQSKKQAQTRQEAASRQQNKTVSANGKFSKQNSQYLNNLIEYDHVA